MTGLQCRQDTLKIIQQAKSLHSLIVGGTGVGSATDIFQMGVLWSNTRVV